MKLFFENLKRKEGQSLIEVVVALGVVIVLITSLVSTSLLTQRGARGAKANTQATKLAEQSLEKMRVFRDRRGFSALVNNSSANCYILDSTNPDPSAWALSTANCPPGENVVLDNITFTRRIQVSSSGQNKLIVVTVSWQDSAGTQTVTNSTILSNWCQGAINPGSPCTPP
ncbi:MAG: hypothetical protein NUV69_00290 [Candidatus Curtissbacteria bacterium]|nr:hypothetical protein [Candidatus Curtissbacteria bacterium]